MNDQSIPVLTLDALVRDPREKDVVEINISKGIATIVEDSEAPILTAEILKERAQPVRYEKLYFDSKVFRVGILHGIPLEVSLESDQLRKTFMDVENTVENHDAQETELQQLLLARMVVDPIFSFKSERKGAYRIEDCSPLLLQSLWGTYCAVNNSNKDEIYRVEVKRGVPLRVSQRIFQMEQRCTPSNKPFDEMLSSDRQQSARWDFETRAIYLSEMIESPSLMFKNEPAPDQYDIELLSEAFQVALYKAYQVVNGDTHPRHLQRLRMIKKYANPN